MTAYMIPLGINRATLRRFFVARHQIKKDRADRELMLGTRIAAMEAQRELDERIRTEIAAGARTRRFGD